MSTLPRRPAALAVLIALLAAGLLLGGRLTSQASPAAPAAAVPAAEAVGRVTIPGLPGSVTFTSTMRGFSTGGTSSGDAGSGGGSGSGAFTAITPTALIDSASTTPLLHRAIATGLHLPTSTVVLFRPGTTTRLEQWKYSDVIFRNLSYAQTSTSRPPRMSLGWTFRRLEITTYATNGTTVLQKSCWDTVTLSTTCP